MTETENQDDQPVILDSTHDAVVGHPVAPEAGVAAMERMAKPSGVFVRGDAVAKETEDPSSDFMVQPSGRRYTLDEVEREFGLDG